MRRKRILTKWEEQKSETISDLCSRLKPDAAKKCPPILLAADYLRIPQVGIAKVLDTCQSRISHFRSGKASLKVPDQKRLIELVEAMAEKAESALEKEITGENNQEWREMVIVQIQAAKIMSNIQKAIVSKKEKANG